MKKYINDGITINIYEQDFDNIFNIMSKFVGADAKIALKNIKHTILNYHRVKLVTLYCYMDYVSYDVGFHNTLNYQIITSKQIINHYRKFKLSHLI